MVGEPLTEDVPESVDFDEAVPERLAVIDDVDVLDELPVLDGDVVAVADLEAELVEVVAAEAVILIDAVEDSDGRAEPVSVRVNAPVAVSERVPLAVAEAERVPIDVAERLTGADRVEVGLLVMVAT
jgi:hypothetical protein